MSERFERTILLTGEAGFESLRSSHVLILGVGGVGAYAAEQIARAGVGKITIVDGDTVDITNCNRQLPALTSTIGKDKVDVVSARIREINPDCEVTARKEFITAESVDALLDSDTFSYAIDAIDQLTPKVFFIMGCRKRKIPLVSCMGSGGKTDPLMLQIADISKTYGCALAKAVRNKLKSYGITKGVKCVFSPQEVSKDAVCATFDEAGVRHTCVGTISYMPAVFGCVCASAALQNLIQKGFAPDAD